MKKFLLSMTMILTLGFGAVGCGTTPPATTDNTTPSPATSEVSSESPATSEVATGDINSQLIKPDELYVGTSPDYAPFEFIDDSGNLTGFDIEMMNAVSQIAGLKVNYQQLNFDTILLSLQNGQIDVGLSGFTYDPERKVIFGTPYYSSAQVALMPADSTATTAADLEGKNIGAGLGTTGEKVANTIKDAKVTTPTNDVAFQMVQAGQLDAYICDLGVGVHYANTDKYKLLPERFSQEDMSMVFKTENQAIADKLNDALTQFMSTPEYTDLLKKYELEQ